MKALLIYNDLSGQRHRRGEIAAAISRLSSAGWQVELATSSEVVEMERLSHAAVAAGKEAVIVAGGDGSINVAIQALANRSVALGVLPTGTGNVWAREMGIPSDVLAATEVLLRGDTVDVDLGLANGRYFLLVASVGFDASVTRDLDPRAKRRLGMLAYVIAAIVEALKLRGEEVTVTIDGRPSRLRILMLLANNIRLYGAVLRMTPEALADDGLLDVWVFEGRGLLEAVRHATLVLLGLHARDRKSNFFKCSEISIEGRVSLPVQLDGDYFGTTPVAITVAPGALRTIVPAGLHPQLRGRQPGDGGGG